MIKCVEGWSKCNKERWNHINTLFDRARKYGWSEYEILHRAYPNKKRALAALVALERNVATCEKHVERLISKLIEDAQRKEAAS